jgi:hypothetical protein
MTVAQGQALRRRAIWIEFRKRETKYPDLEAALKLHRWLPKLPRKLKKRLRHGFEVTFMADVRKQHPHAREPRTWEWQRLWYHSWRSLCERITAELHEAMLEQLMVQEDRRILGTMQAAAEGAPLCRG